MNIIQPIKSYLHLFAPVTVEQDVQHQHKAALKEIAESNETIKRAAYIRFMAQKRVEALEYWLQATVFAYVASDDPAEMQQVGESSNGQQ